MLAAGALVALAVAALVRRSGRRIGSDASRDLDWFLAGAATFARTLAVGHNYNYRMGFLLLTLPRLLCWERDEAAPVTRAPSAVAAVVVATRRPRLRAA